MGPVGHHLNNHSDKDPIDPVDSSDFWAMYNQHTPPNYKNQHYTN